jgi:hypothetical protein
MSSPEAHMEDNVQMTIEELVHEALATESTASGLSDRLFSPSGLFSYLADSEETRQQLVRSSLFRQAQRRLTELQQKEADEFSRVVAQLEGGLAGRGQWLALRVS